MRILVVEADHELGRLWCNHLDRQGGKTELVTNESDALAALRFRSFEVLVLDLMLPGTSVLGIADFASYRQPEIAIIVVTANSFFSDGSIFKLVPNARGLLHAPVLPEDLAALVDYYGRHAMQL
ncbi:MAG: response regulator [Rhodobacteraceae bacterium]|nr:response regulator [Paracoccaceae bacterium]